LKNKLLLVEWVDSVQPVSAWHFLSDLPPLEVVQCASVGWVVGKTKKVIMLAPNIGGTQSGDSRQGSGFIRIPVAAITRKVELVEK